VVLGLGNYSTALLIWSALIALAIGGYLPLALQANKRSL